MRTQRTKGFTEANGDTESKEDWREDDRFIEGAFLAKEEWAYKPFNWFTEEKEVKSEN